MKLVSLVLSILIAAGALLLADKTFGQSDVSPVVALENRFDAEPPPADGEIINLVLDFAPGVWLPLHIHSGPGYATVLEGTMTRRGEGTDRTFGVGEGWGVRALGERGPIGDGVRHRRTQHRIPFIAHRSGLIPCRRAEHAGRFRSNLFRRQACGRDQGPSPAASRRPLPPGRGEGQQCRATTHLSLGGEVGLRQQSG